MEQFCKQKGLIFYAQPLETSGSNHFAFDPSLNNANDESFKRFLRTVASKIQQSQVGSSDNQGLGGAELVLKETSAEEIEKILQVYRKEAANVSTKASILGEHNARDSMV